MTVSWSSSSPNSRSAASRPLSKSAFSTASTRLNGRRSAAGFWQMRPKRGIFTCWKGWVIARHSLIGPMW